LRGAVRLLIPSQVGEIALISTVSFVHRNLVG
jgi:hypothetical protein